MFGSDAVFGAARFGLVLASSEFDHGGQPGAVAGRVLYQVEHAGSLGQRAHSDKKHVDGALVVRAGPR